MADEPLSEMRIRLTPPGRIGFNRRFVAFAIDVIAIWILTSVTGLVTGDDGSAIPSSLNDLSDLTALMASVGVVVSAVQLLYCLIEGLTGASPGKMIRQDSHPGRQRRAGRHRYADSPHDCKTDKGLCDAACLAHREPVADGMWGWPGA